VKAAGVTLCAVIVLAAGYAVGGPAGLFVIAGAAALGALLTARLRIPGQSRPAARSGLARYANAAFPRYRHIDLALSEARVSKRHFDLVTRPLLQRLLAALVADRHGVDLGKDTAVARDAMGEDLWPLLDPARLPSDDSQAPGVSLETLAAIVDRLEDV
jgi:hypothetical protein